MYVWTWMDRAETKARATPEKAAAGIEMCFVHWRPFLWLDPKGGRIKNKKRTERHSRPLAWQFCAQQSTASVYKNSQTHEPA